ncbi:Glu-tRNA(Gln) amidotransferase subunit GatE [Candidatus Woesearchaeota archaeon]|nr:Glu-tRNA(Gln) amidotransferase subunit GatE [Candidatus Woesearchaeota archaeon]
MDYIKLGFKCGLEIHQQLEGRKLFCHCIPGAGKKEPDAEVVRKLRASAGEMGIIDISAKHEMEKGRHFIYESSSESTCLVELDEEPIHQLSQEALDTALTVSLLLNCTIADEIVFMRKTVIDGSNTSGFQRTALIAYNGFLETSRGKVIIPTICLEEEAAQKVEESNDCVRYRLDRLGIPLIEIATDASLKDPEHVKESAEKIGMILRSTGKVRRGIGTIRQDVNLSIKGHPRVEIKGFQDLRSIIKTINIEVQRQLAEKKPESHVRKVNPDFTTSYLRPMPGPARMYVETDMRTIRISKEALSRIKLPSLISEKANNLEKFGIGGPVADKLAREGKDAYFVSLFGKFSSLKPSFIVEAFLSVKAISKDFSAPEQKLTDQVIEKALALVDEGKLQKGNMYEAMADIAKGKFEIGKYSSASENELESAIESIVKEKPGLKEGAYMGLIMGKFHGKVDGKKAMQILKRLIG